MDRKLIFGLLIFSITILCVACKEPIDFLPPATQTGQNTLGFLVDGKPYIPEGTSGLFSTNIAIRGGLMGSHFGSGLALHFSTYGSKDNNGVITVHLDNYKLGINPVNNGNWAKADLIGRKYFATYSRNDGWFLSSSAHKGWINLTKADSVSGIVSGTFEFILADTTGRTVSITDGRFDLNSRTQ
jgi:hypothetical protein